MPRLLLLLVSVLTLAACTEVPTGPDPTNVFDPEFGGAREVSAPGTPTLVASTPSSITLAWGDSSSFEAGFRIERARVGRDGSSEAFEAVAVAPANATSITLPQASSVEGSRYRVVALAAGRDRESAPTAAVHLRVPTTTVQRAGVRELLLARGTAFTPDGAILYGITAPFGQPPTSLSAVRTEDGNKAWSVVGPSVLLRRIASGDLAALERTQREIGLVVVSPDGDVRRRVSLSQSAGCEIAGVDDALTRVVGTCFGDVTVWDAADGQVLDALARPGIQARAVSPDGRTLLALRGDEGTLAAFALDQSPALWQTRWCGGMEVSPDSRFTLVSGCERDAQLFRTASGATVSLGDARAASRFDASGRSVYSVSHGADRQMGVTDVEVFRLDGGARVRSLSFRSSQGSAAPSSLLVLPDDGVTLVTYTDRYDPLLIRWAPGSRWEVVP